MTPCVFNNLSLYDQTMRLYLDCKIQGNNSHESCVGMNKDGLLITRFISKLEKPLKETTLQKSEQYLWICMAKISDDINITDDVAKILKKRDIELEGEGNPFQVKRKFNSVTKEYQRSGELVTNRCICKADYPLTLVQLLAILEQAKIQGIDKDISMNIADNTEKGIPIANRSASSLVASSLSSSSTLPPKIKEPLTKNEQLLSKAVSPANIGIIEEDLGVIEGDLGIIEEDLGIIEGGLEIIEEDLGIV